VSKQAFIFCVVYIIKNIMSLLSEETSTFLQATNGLYCENLQVKVPNGQVLLSQAVISVPTGGLAATAGGAVYSVPLTTVIPVGAVVIQSLIDVTTAVTGANATYTLGFGTSSTNLQSTQTPTVAVALTSAILNPVLAVSADSNLLNIKVTGTGSLTAGVIAVKILYLA
jgi:hypothetical protein